MRLMTAHHPHRTISKIGARRHALVRQQLVNIKPALPDPVVKPPVVATPPWTFPAPSVALFVPGLRTKKNEVAILVLRHLALDMMQTRYSPYTAPFTEGSSTLDSSAASYVIPSGPVPCGYAPSQRTSSTSAELHALFLCLSKLPVANARSWVLHCDSKPALQLIELRGVRRSHALRVLDILNKIQLLEGGDHSVCSQWILRHQRQ